MTRGEYLVGIKFNQPPDDLVSEIKRKAAAMYAVKSATKPSLV